MILEIKVSLYFDILSLLEILLTVSTVTAAACQLTLIKVVDSLLNIC